MHVPVVRDFVYFRIGTQFVIVESRRWIDARTLARDDHPLGITYIILTIDTAVGRHVFGQFVHIVSRIGSKIPRKILITQNRRPQSELDAPVHLFGCIISLRNKSDCRIHARRSHEIVSFTVVCFDLQSQTILEKSDVQTRFDIPGLLPAQMRIRGIRNSPHPVGIRIGNSKRVIVFHDDYRIDRLIDTARITRGQTERHRTDHIRDFPFHPRLFVYIPRKTCRPGSIELLLAAEIIRSVGSYRGIENIAVEQDIVDRTVERGHSVFRNSLPGGIIEGLPETDKFIVIDHRIVSARRIKRRRVVARNGVVAVTFGKNRLGVIPADLRSGQHIEPMYFVESMSIGEMSP